MSYACPNCCSTAQPLRIFDPIECPACRTRFLRLGTGRLAGALAGSAAISAVISAIALLLFLSSASAVPIIAGTVPASALGAFFLFVRLLSRPEPLTDQNLKTRGRLLGFAASIPANLALVGPTWLAWENLRHGQGNTCAGMMAGLEVLLILPFVWTASTAVFIALGSRWDERRLAALTTAVSVAGFAATFSMF